ncbi:SubName: Full=Uncharacterized protein {ECO:0000313/EMBL:CCA67778.1} [Serendipita indica DSM 11827]|uniref:CASTOR ACT domain-containing protein n=1 Tax=Serendipita indica (strain DSM 11827) TaxID=1109443 RepID=G4T8W7_SERID|nr:SubName: Full=Uncharacterized protein {ECO:0000313/EMBL:CCA67778.1} [Serendipita indica DSM 11827]CCA67778.1 hypothetical protein PIIN_01602 [Serendipita indica DSM 11827]
MPPPDSSSTFDLLVHPDALYLYKLAPSASTSSFLSSLISDDASATDQRTPPQARFRSIIWTSSEISLVTDTKPPENLQLDSDSVVEYAALRIRGPMDLSLTGILYTLLEPLKAAGIPIFTLSTWNTDYVLVPLERKERALHVLEDDAWRIIIMQEQFTA